MRSSREALSKSVALRSGIRSGSGHFPSQSALSDSFCTIAGAMHATYRMCTRMRMHVRACVFASLSLVMCVACNARAKKRAQHA